ncbi:glycoside hydrolase family 18 and carbohydrate-binding module family 5 protein [Rhizoctonia solani]|nr:glycoside hydrolase family 18 and carbohydrate-binding module family 5 protein [Rhizoctonia solani]
MHIHSLLIALGAALSASASRIHHRPDNYLTKAVPNTPPSNRTVTPQPLHERIAVLDKRANGKVNIGYFVNRGIYARTFYPQNIDTSTLTHILYSFADVDPSTGTVKLSDPDADQLVNDSDSWNDTGNNLYGNSKQLYLLKQKNRSLKVLLSIGGWTYSQAGHFNFVTDASARATFISSAISLLEDNGLDRMQVYVYHDIALIDIDYEYPSAGAQAQGYVALLSELRTALNSHATKKGETNPYQITAAVPAGKSNYANLLISQMDPSLTFWNLMAYDYAGSWSTTSDDQANLYRPTNSGTDTDTAIKYYTASGATISKIVMGMPLYGRAFENTYGIRKPFNGIGPSTWEAGVYDYKALPLSGAVVYEDSTVGSSYSYDSSKKELVSYDTPNIIRQKAAYQRQGPRIPGMFWELSSDKKGADSLVTIAATNIGALDTTPNHLYYPNSQFDNIKNNMGAGSGGPDTAVPPSPTTTQPPATTTSPVTSAPATTTTQAPGHKWTAKWWNQSESPGGASDAWTDNGAC